MKPWFTALLFCLFAGSLQAQGFHGVHSPDGQAVWAAGKAGLIWRSTDGGANWQNFSTGSATLRSLYTRDQRVWIVGDGGTFLYSSNGAGSWSQQILAGGTNLRAITFADSLNGWIGGDNGLVLKTTDGGENWFALSTADGHHIYAVASRDEMVVFAAGQQGTLLKTTNGGNTWIPAGHPQWQLPIFSVSVRDSLVYVAGADGFCYRGRVDNGSWQELNFKTESRSDVNKVHALSTDTAFFVGGGGFIRKTVDKGSSYQWGVHNLHARLVDVFFVTSSRGWACSDKNNAILRTTDGGATWQLPQGTTVSYSWSQKLSGGSIGSTFMINPLNKDHIYVVLGNNIYMSADLGESWVLTATITGGGSSTHSFYISSKDTNIYLAASASFSSGDRIMRSTNRGQTWQNVIQRNFTSYGMPLEVNPNYPDTVLFFPDGTSGGNGVVYVSGDFGETWDTLAQAQFRSPCDIVYVPDSTNILYVGDGVTGSGQGQMFRSTNGGLTWTLIYTNSAASEIPMISISPLKKERAFATAWSSSGGPIGGFMRTTNYGVGWSQVASTNSTWGTDIARDDPNVVMYGVYGGSTSYLSTNGGTSFSTSSLSGSNSGILCYDRATLLAQQTGGVSKYSITYTVPVTQGQSMVVVSPNGGENWQYNSLQNITWGSAGVSNVRIEYRVGSGSAQTIVSSTPAATGSYSWTVPNVKSTQVRILISDAADGTPIDSSNGFFTISVPEILASRTSVGFGTVGIGEQMADTIRIHNPGTATLVVTDAYLPPGSFGVSRTSFTVPAGGSDTLTVVFAPISASAYSDTLRFAVNAPTDPYEVLLSGIGTSSAYLTLEAPGGGEVWSALSIHTIRWDGALMDSVALFYRLSDTDSWRLINGSIPASPERYEWAVPSEPTAEARVLVAGRPGVLPSDSSHGYFSITAAMLITAASLDLGMVMEGQTGSDTIRILNTGTETLSIVDASTTSPFSVSRSSLDIASGASDTLTVSFTPPSVGSYNGVLVFLSNSVSGPDTVELIGTGIPVTSVEEPSVARSFKLLQNQPNPFNPTTEIRYEIPADGIVQLKVYNTLGQEVATLVDQYQPAGSYRILFNSQNSRGAPLSSGLYFYRLQFGDHVASKKMILMK